MLANKATDWIAANKEQPFFLYLATTHIHHPYTPGKKFQQTSDAALYGDFIQELDWMVSQVTNCLEKNGLSDNTLVIFTSDNGGMLNLGGRTAVKLGHRLNGDLLGFKFGAWEGGPRVPFIARWPRKIAAGSESDQLISHIDMLATFMELTGQAVPPEQVKDSINQLPVMLGTTAEPLRDELVLAPYRKSHLSLRKGKWMYIPRRGSGGFTGSRPNQHAWGGPPAITFASSINSDIENGKYKKGAPPAQLYNLEGDRSQTQNVYREYPEVVELMQRRLEAYGSQASRKASTTSQTDKPSLPERSDNQ